MNPVSTDTLSLSHPILEQLRQRSGNNRMRERNTIRVLQDCGENFPAWRKAIQSAQQFICIEMYIFADNDFGKEILQLLIEKQQAGVQVVLVYDWLGSLWQWAKRFFAPLERAGGLVVPYNRIGFASGLGLASRNHRKSFIIDGNIAFVSGLCISSAWAGQPEKDIAPWRDTGVMLEGEVVADVFAAFCDTLKSQNQSLPENIRLPENRLDGFSGSQRVGIVATTPNDNNMMRADLNTLALVNHHLWITDAYFMPTRLYTQALINASEAGVDVRILVPKTSDIRWIANVSQTRYRELLQAGVRIFEWNGTMIHAKSAIADGIWARVGSTNLNFASWHLNRELDVIIEDVPTISALEAQFLHDLSQASELFLQRDEFKIVRERRRKRFASLKAVNRQQAKALARQVMQLSHAFEGNFYGKNIVDESESKAYLSLGLTLLFFALLLWFAPYLLVVPVGLLLLAGGVSTVIYAIKQMRKFKHHKSSQPTQKS
ncbi:phospholipase D-like domain-containing protein [Neisseriaceae bacterium B1]